MTADKLIAEAATVAADVRGWLASGALQAPTGAICAWRDGVTGELAFEYPEITGYALTHFAGQPDRSAEETARAHAAGRWLADRLERGDLWARQGWDDHAVYNFDLAMIATGLFNLGRRDRDERLLVAARELVRDLCDQHDAAGVLPSIRAGTEVPSARSAWSTEGFAHLVKSVQCLLLDGSERALAVAAEIIDHSEGWQRDDGRFVTHPRDGETMLHPHLYAIEGLWMYAEATGDPQARERARAGVDWAWRFPLDTGGLPRYTTTETGEPGPEQLDVTSQAVRMAFLAGEPGPATWRGVERLAEVSVDTAQGPALPYQPDAEQLHLNAWVSMFGCQALATAAGTPLQWSALV